jgi:hypothetical protein
MGMLLSRDNIKHVKDAKAPRTRVLPFWVLILGAYFHTGDNRVKKQTQGKTKAKNKILKNAIPGA